MAANTNATRDRKKATGSSYANKNGSKIDEKHKRAAANRNSTAKTRGASEAGVLARRKAEAAAKDKKKTKKAPLTVTIKKPKLGNPKTTGPANRGGAKKVAAKSPASAKGRKGTGTRTTIKAKGKIGNYLSRLKRRPAPKPTSAEKKRK